MALIFSDFSLQVEWTLNFIVAFVSIFRINIVLWPHFNDIHTLDFIAWTAWSNTSCSTTCGGGEIIESRDCIDTDTNEMLQPTECGSGPFSIAHGCLIDLCWETVIQRRGQFGNSLDYFYREWDDYLAGFGDPGNTGRINGRAQRLINLEIPVLVRSLKSSNIELG